MITISSLPESVKSAERCIKSAKDKSGIDVEMFDAITPKHNPWELAEKLNIKTDLFANDIGSRPDNVLSAFLSHYRLWSLCANSKEEYTIFEHDAVVLAEIPKYMSYQGCVSLGTPSYGKFQQPFQMGVIPLTSKAYFPGAHAYRMRPSGAKTIVEMAQHSAQATDVFLNRANFPWLEELYPWPVIAKDSFTTIQNQTGCLAKHNYNAHYEILPCR